MLTWLAALATVSVLVLYEAALAFTQRRRPERLARSIHATLREEWFAAVSAQKGSEILAVQTLRNSLMSATMTASTAVLGLMGTVTLAAPSLHATFGEASAGVPISRPDLRWSWCFLSCCLLRWSLRQWRCATYNHAGFIGGMPVESDARKRWAAAGSAYVRRAGLLYSWGLRHLILVVPIVAFILHPAAGPVAAVVVAGVLFVFDRPYGGSRA